jgi:hypothetical protein
LLTDGVAQSNVASVTLHVQPTPPPQTEANDAALLALLGGEGEAWNSLIDGGTNDYQDAVDQLMAMLG